MTKLIVSLTKSHKKALIGKLFLAILLAVSLIVQTNAQTIDTTPPEISEFSFSPSVIDTTDSDQTVTVTIRVADPESEVYDASVLFKHPTRYEYIAVSLRKENLISGDSKDGVYRATAVFPQYSKAGTWVVSNISAVQGIQHPDGSIGGLVSNFNTYKLAARGFATQLQVISNNEDITPPKISEFRFTPDTINLAPENFQPFGGSNPQTITFTVRVKDTQSGVAGVSVIFRLPSAFYPNCGVSMDSRDRILGDEKDGVYQKTETLRCGTSPATLYASVQASDKIKNVSVLDTTQLAARGYSSQLTIIAPRRNRRTRFGGSGEF